jgi:hypothetical protein
MATKLKDEPEVVALVEKARADAKKAALRDAAKIVKDLGAERAADAKQTGNKDAVVYLKSIAADAVLAIKGLAAEATA